MIKELALQRCLVHALFNKSLGRMTLAEASHVDGLREVTEYVFLHAVHKSLVGSNGQFDLSRREIVFHTLHE
jgi:hypothetical protein